MSAPTAPHPAAPDARPAPRRLPVVLAGMAGCLFLVVATSSPDIAWLPQFLNPPFNKGASSPSSLQEWMFLVAPVAATALGLWLLRWWPYLLAAAALMAVPGVMAELNVYAAYPWGFLILPSAGYALAVVALLACAQGLIRTSVGWGAAVAALTLGSRLVGSAAADGLNPQFPPHNPASWHTALLGAGLAGLAPAVWLYRRGDPAANGPAGNRSWQRARLVMAGTLAAAVTIPLAFLTTQRLADLLGVTWDQLYRHGVAQTAVIGAITLVAVTVLAALAGLWPLAGALTAAVAQVAVMAPVVLTVTALQNRDPLRWLAALAGAALGAAIAGSRLRVPLAATLTVLGAMALFIEYGATTSPDKLEDPHVVIPSVLILVVCAAAGGAVVGATAPMLGTRGSLPAVLGPLAGTLVVGGLQVIEVTDLSDGEPLPSFLNPLTTSAILLLVAGAAVGGLGFAQLLAARRAERKHAEQIRREAAIAERDRLGRSIHDGVLQVLALVQRQGSDLGGRGSELAALAGEQEVALRGLLAGTGSADADEGEDLCAPLRALTGPAVEVATPAHAVTLPSGITAEVVAAVRAAVDNVRKHAGTDAQAWIFLEDERDGVRVTVRDNGIGFPPERPAEAAKAGRLGIAQSMRGRIADCGGTTTIHSRPGAGTEVEFWVPRVLRTRP
ncbi:MAG TPA: ATP-binding protein [Streptosporangiaceae bacterium]|nr:ATP-binding protein [Streptosporangiaceae bacterium]